MNLQTLPDGQLTQRFKLAREAAEKLGHADRFSKVPLAVSFSAGLELPADDPFTPQHSKTFTNAQGQQQGTCIHLGNCDIGCDVRAKNTLDLNYIPLAEQHGAEVRPLHVVNAIERSNGGYKVVFDRIERGTPGSRQRDGRRACSWRREASAPPSCCCGAATSTGRCRDSAALLGRNWSANANLLSTAVYTGHRPRPADARPEHRERDRFHRRQPERRAVRHRGRRVPESDSEFAARLPRRAGDGGGLGRTLLKQIEEHVSADPNLRNVMVWLGAGMDAGDGQLSLKRRLFLPWVRDLDLQWNPQTLEGRARGDPGRAPQGDRRPPAAA